MSQTEPPERPRANFVQALSVPRNAKVGFGVGALLAGFLLYGVVEGPPGQYSVAYYVALAFVLAIGVGLLVTFLLTLGSAYRLAKRE